MAQNSEQTRIQARWLSSSSIGFSCWPVTPHYCCPTTLSEANAGVYNTLALRQFLADARERAEPLRWLHLVAVTEWSDPF